MKQLCAWCGNGIRKDAAENEADAPVSHGICHACAGGMLTAKPQELRGFLDRFAFPVLLVNADGSIVLANHQACDMLALSPESFPAQDFGSVAECVYAKETGGCGRSVHCTGCTLRRTLVDTAATGKNHQNVPASLQLLPRKIAPPVECLISTEKSGGFILLELKKIQKPQPLPDARPAPPAGGDTDTQKL